MRLAWFSPMPPVRSGIAACSAELVAALAGEHLIDVYQDGGVGSAHEFVWRHRLKPYDLTVFQLGNSSHHDYAWPYLFRYPGLAVLHDAHLHHARAAALLRTRRAEDYRAEFAANHPEASRDSAELAVAGFDSYLYYSWPMTRLVAEASRTTAVHAAGVASRLREEAPGAAIETIRLGHGRLVTPGEAAAARARVRATLGLAADRVVFGVFGGLTPDKRIPQILDALAHVRAYVPSAHLLLVGAPARHYDVVSDVQARGLAEHVTLTGYLDDEDEMTAHLAACDVSLNLRWPTAREMSGPWLRALAAGRATVIVDLAHLTDVPSLDPRTWTMNYSTDSEPRVPSPEPRVPSPDPRPPTPEPRVPSPEPRPPTPEPRVPSPEPRAPSPEPRAPSPVTIAVDILDEDHSLRLAMRRLATDADLRATLGMAGQAYWEREHSLDAMLADYRRVLPLAAARPAPRVELPAHLRNDGGHRLRELSRELGVSPVLLE